MGQERLVKNREVSLLADELQLVGKSAAGHQENVGQRSLLLKLQTELQPVVFAEHVIEQHDIRPALVESETSLWTIFGDQNFPAFLFQLGGKKEEEVVVVVYDENRRSLAGQRLITAATLD